MLSSFFLLLLPKSSYLLVFNAEYTKML